MNIHRTEALLGDVAIIVVLHNYIDTLNVTLKKLRKICIKLHVKSQGKAYGWREYRQDVKEYQVLVRFYQEAGAALNQVLRTQ